MKKFQVKLGPKESYQLAKGFRDNLAAHRQQKERLVVSDRKSMSDVQRRSESFENQEFLLPGIKTHSLCSRLINCQFSDLIHG